MLECSEMSLKEVHILVGTNFEWLVFTMSYCGTGYDFNAQKVEHNDLCTIMHAQ